MRSASAEAIAAYKAAELARALMERGFTVQAIMTQAAEEFVRPLTFAALTGRKVMTNLFSAASAEDTLASAIEHIRVAEENQILVIAPATADLLAKLAHGFAGDFLTTMYLAFTGPVVLAPAMNTNMWNHPATQENLRILRERGHIVIEPEDGILACGMVGPGRLAEPETIAEAVAQVMAGLRDKPAGRNRDLEGETVLITAGPTQEPLDAVRYLSNRSSGKMGYALAAGALERGARVILVSGPVHLEPPRGAETIQVRTAVEMRAAVMEHLKPATMIIKAAAVADYHRVERAQPQTQEDSRAAFSGAGSHAGYSGGARAEEGRPAAGGLRGGNRESGGRSAAQAGIEKLRHGGGEPGGARSGDAGGRGF